MLVGHIMGYMKKIELTQNKFALVDVVDNDLSQMSWHINIGGYAARSGHIGSKRGIVFMHRVVLERKLGRKLNASEYTDHINRDKLNNTRSNLRAVSASQNAINITRRSDSTSGFTGIHFDKYRNKYRVHVTYKRKTHFLGRCETIEEAIIIRKAGELKYWK